MIKALVICGPTATGKTSLAAKLARRFGGEIISADSRQVYQGMDIVTGKDRPKGVKIHGLDLVQPNQQFSVAHFVKSAHSLINQIIKRKKLPIIVGGTGLYLNSLVNPPQTITLPPDWRLRKDLETFSAPKLLKLLKQLNPKKVKAMNRSDKNNPRRLIRAIEVALRGDSLQVGSRCLLDCLWIGLTADKKVLDQQIEKRVRDRVAAGAIAEWQKLKTKYQQDLPSMSGIGYRELPNVARWIRAEQQYARRQLTWFKKNKQIHWFNITSPHWQSALVKLVNSWYT